MPSPADLRGPCRGTARSPQALPFTPCAALSGGWNVSSVWRQAARTPAHPRVLRRVHLGGPADGAGAWAEAGRGGPAECVGGTRGGGGAPDQEPQVCWAPASAPAVHAPSGWRGARYRSRQRRGACVPVTARWPGWLPGTWPRAPGVAWHGGRGPAGGCAHGPACACTEHPQAQGVPSSSVSQGALDTGSWVALVFCASRSSNPLSSEQQAAHAHSRAVPSEGSACRVRNRWGRPPATLSLESVPQPWLVTATPGDIRCGTRSRGWLPRTISEVIFRTLTFLERICKGLGYF